MSNIVIDTLQGKRAEVNAEYERLHKELEQKSRDLKQFSNRVLEVQDMVNELDSAIQRETMLHFDGKAPECDIPF